MSWHSHKQEAFLCTSLRARSLLLRCICQVTELLPIPGQRTNSIWCTVVELRLEYQQNSENPGDPAVLLPCLRQKK